VPPATDPGPEDDRSVDRERSLYVGACRIDLVRRAGTTRLLSDARLAGTVARALEAANAPAPASVTIVLTDDAELRDLNRTHLERDEPTDVLSFPIDGRDDLPEGVPRALGDVVLCPQVVGDEWRWPLTHGLLHLLGYKHGDEMDAREEQLLAGGVGVTEPQGR
jgi:probable rRNA maturation factor